jgi:hypothetical protein
MAITNRALAFATRWFDQATVARIFDPLIADWQREWQEAPPSQRTRVSIRGLAAFICACLVSSPEVLLTRAPKSVTDRVAIRMTRFIALASLVLLTPLLMQLADDARYGMLMLTMLPSAITTTFPLSLIAAADALRRTQPLASNVERALALKLAIVSFLFMIVFGGFVVPASHQAFRVIQTEGGAPVIRAVRELTTWQLITDPTMAAAQEPYTGGADRATRIQRELNNRTVLSVLPLLILWVRWRAIERGQGRWWSPLPSTIAVLLAIAVFVVSQFAGFVWERHLHLPAGAGHWLTVIAFVFWGVAAPTLAHYAVKPLKYLRYVRYPDI